jgi:hypothetical protein
MSGKLVVILCVFALASAHHERVDSMQQARVKQLVDLIQGPETGYVPSVRPYGVNGTDATKVFVSLRDINVIDVDETKGRFTFQAYFRQEWVDTRLAYNDTKIDYIPIRECKNLWFPDLFFLNGVETSFTHKPTRLIKIYPDGRVFYSLRLTQTVTCPTVFNKEQTEFSCFTMLESYGFFSDEVQVDFQTEGVSAITPRQQVLPPRFTFQGVNSARCETRKARSNDVDGHLHSCLQVDFKFVRNAVKV